MVAARSRRGGGCCGKIENEIVDSEIWNIMSDLPEWLTNPEHAHIIGLDNSLADALRAFFKHPDIQVDCGVEGKHSHTYHFRIRNVPADLHRSVWGHASDLLSEWTPYRFEVQCV
jgi:hypothetical protein